MSHSQKSKRILHLQLQHVKHLNLAFFVVNRSIKAKIAHLGRREERILLWYVGPRRGPTPLLVREGAGPPPETRCGRMARSSRARMHSAVVAPTALAGDRVASLVHAAGSP